MHRLLPLFTLLACACGVKPLLPQGPVIGGWERSSGWPGPEPSGVVYTDAPRTPFPVIPIQVWGAIYDIDIVVVSDHPDWDMHEVARVRTADGPLWVAKDARAGTLEQSIVTDLADLERWVPEIPVERRSVSIEVEDRSTPDLLDLTVRYENLDGDAVEIAYRGKPPVSAQRKRNGSTFGHSRDTLLAVLDVSHRNFGKSATVTIAGQERRVERIAGLLPFRMVLHQAQGGLAIADMHQVAGDPWHQEPSSFEGASSYPSEAVDAGFGGGPVDPGVLFTSTWTTRSGSAVSQPWRRASHDGIVDVVQQHPFRELRYRFLDTGTALELAWAESRQWGQPGPTVHVELHPALPDLRRRFEGRHTSRYVIDVNGQQNHAVGTVEAWWEEDGPRVAVTPEEPWWTADRPMLTTVEFGDGEAHVRIERVE